MTYQYPPSSDKDLHLQRWAKKIEEDSKGRLKFRIYYRISDKLKPYQRSVLEAIERLRDERQDFREDEKRAGRRLKLRRGGVCCVGLVARIGAALTGNSKREAAKN